MIVLLRRFQALDTHAMTTAELMNRGHVQHEGFLADRAFTSYTQALDFALDKHSVGLPVESVISMYELAGVTGTGVETPYFGGAICLGDCDLHIRIILRYLTSTRGSK